MLRLGKFGAILDDEGANGFGPNGNGATFHFESGISIFISKEMADRITSTMSHLNKLELEKHGKAKA